MRDNDVWEHHIVAQSRDTAHRWCMPLALRICALHGAVVLGSMSNEDRRIR